MAESLLITLDQLREQYDVSKNYREERLTSHIWRAQRNDVQPFIGGALYYDLMENITLPKYVLLVEGGTYTFRSNPIYFQGLKQLTGAYTYARLIEHNNTFVAAKGNKVKTDPNSQPTEKAIVDEEMRGAQSEGFNIAQGIIQFLNNTSDYPLWNQRTQPPRKSFSFTKV